MPLGQAGIQLWNISQSIPGVIIGCQPIECFLDPGGPIGPRQTVEQRSFASQYYSSYT
jgi:hypothetical protein